MSERYPINERLIEMSNSCIEHLTKYKNKMNKDQPMENELSFL